MIIMDQIFNMIQEEQSFVDCNLNFIYNKITYQHYIHKISSSQALHTCQNPYMQETRKIDTLFHFIYTRNFPREMERKYCIMGSINGNKQ